MDTKYTEYRNATFLVVGLACVMVLTIHLVMANTLETSSVHIWAASMGSLTTPVLAFWIGGLLRTLYPKPKAWVTAALLALLPLMYIRLMIWPYTSIFFRFAPGYYVMMLSLVIMGFLLLPVSESIKDRGWLMLALFFASVFCYAGIVRVSDHFSIVNFTLRDSEWTTLFTRMIKYVPLVMSLFFLMAFALSDEGQQTGGMKWLKWVTVIMVLASGLYIYLQPYWSYVKARFIFFHPLTVYLVVILVRILKGEWKRKPWKELLSI